MKKSGTFHASHSLLGTLLLLSFFSTLAMHSLDSMTDLYTVFKSQWYQFAESLTSMQPHRTVFPR